MFLLQNIQQWYENYYNGQSGTSSYTVVGNRITFSIYKCINYDYRRDFDGRIEIDGNSIRIVETDQRVPAIFSQRTPPLKDPYK